MMNKLEMKQNGQIGNDGQVRKVSNRLIEKNLRRNYTEGEVVWCAGKTGTGDNV